MTRSKIVKLDDQFHVPGGKYWKDGDKWVACDYSRLLGKFDTALEARQAIDKSNKEAEEWCKQHDGKGCAE